jgi:sugar lactone lactonase YvrE
MDKVSVFLADSKRGDGQSFGPDGRLYAAAGAEQKILAWDAEGRATAVAEGFRGNDLVVASNGNIYVTFPGWNGSDPQPGDPRSAQMARRWSSIPASASRTASPCRPTRRCSMSPDTQDALGLQLPDPAGRDTQT